MSITTAYEIPYPGAVENDDYCIVRDGDTLESIAEKYLGESFMYPLLTQLNGVYEETLQPGMVLLLHPEED